MMELLEHVVQRTAEVNVTGTHPAAKAVEDPRGQELLDKVAPGLQSYDDP